MNLPKFSALSLAAAIAFTGCTQKPATNNAVGIDPAILAAELKAAYLGANELMMGGKTNDAVALIGKTLADAKFANFEEHLSQALNDRQPEYPPMPDPENPDAEFDWQPQEPDISFADLERRRFLLDYMVRLSLQTATPDDALDRVIPLFKADPKLALDGVNLIYEDIRARIAPAELLAWIARLNKTPRLPEAAAIKFKEWEIHAALEGELDDRAISVLSGLLAKHSDDPAIVELARRSVNLLVRQSRLDSVAKLIEALKRMQAEPVKNLVLASQARLAAARADWNACAGFMIH